jgi:hypothetical protein
MIRTRVGAVDFTGAARRSGRPEGGCFGRRSPPGSRGDLVPAGGWGPDLLAAHSSKSKMRSEKELGSGF